MVKFNAKSLKDSLAINIGLMSRGLISDGVDTKEVDQLAQDVMTVIQDRASYINKRDDPRFARNIVQTVVMVLMHAVLSEQEEFIAHTSGELGISREKVEELMMKDTLESSKKAG